MRFLVWVCRLIMLVVVAAFVATIFYVTHDVGTQMDSAKPALNLITVIGAALLGFLWPLMRRYWQAFALLVSLGALRILFGQPELFKLDLLNPLLTPFQSDFLWIPIGVAPFMLLVTLVARAVASDRKLRAMKQVVATANLAPTSATLTPVATYLAAAVPSPPVAAAPDLVAAPVEPEPAVAPEAAAVPEPAVAEETPVALEEAAPASGRKRKK
jgi:hypothetical protein